MSAGPDLGTAERIADALSASPAIEGVCVYGSVARGDQTAESDLDILVTGTETGLSSRHLRDRLPPDLRHADVSLSYYPTAALDRLFQRRLAFASHVADEGRILFDRNGALHEIMREVLSRPAYSEEEMRLELERLESLEDVRQFNGYFLFCFAHLYAIGKAVVMLALAREGAPEYRRASAFDALRARHPDVAGHVDAVEALKPYYDVAVRGRDRALPPPGDDDGRRVTSVVAGIRAIARGDG